MEGSTTFSRLTKPRLSTFTSFYSRTAKSLPPRSKSLDSSSHFIDEEMIDIIDRITPNKIHRHLDKRMSKSFRIKTEQAIRPVFASTGRVDQVWDHMREESIRKNEGSMMAQARVRKKFKKKQPKQSKFFKYDGLKWMQRKWDTKGVRGMHSQKLHPYCLIYEEQALQVNGKGVGRYDPFDSYVHIEFT